MTILLITLAMGEVSVRWFLGLRPFTIDSTLWEYHPTRGWAHRPNSSEVFVRLGFQQHIQINSRGLREREIRYERSPGIGRILVIGDSGVASFEVAQDQTFTRVAERTLREHGLEVEVLNGGTRGYGTDQSLLFLIEEGIRYRPDLVLYRIGSNDGDDIITIHKPFRQFGKSYFDWDQEGTLVLQGVPVPFFPYTQRLRVDEDGTVTEYDVPLRLRCTLWLRDHTAGRSALVAALVHVSTAAPDITRAILRAGSTDELVDMSGPDRGSRKFRLARSLVAEMRRVAEANGARFLLIGPGGRWATLLREDLDLPDLKDWSGYQARIPDGVQTHVPYDPHMNATGHELYGNALAEALIDLGVLTP